MVLPPVRTLEELKMTFVERVPKRPKQWRQDGIEQGKELVARLMRLAKGRDAR